MTVDAVVCTKDRPREVERCLKSLAAQTNRPARVIIVDASGSPGHAAAPGLRLELIASSPALPRQRNVALSLATADLVAFFDDDVELEPDYLAEAIRFFEAHPDCAALTGNITNDPVRPAASRLFRSAFSLANDDGMLRPSGDANYLRHPARPTRVDVVSGSNMVFRRAAIGDATFDERLDGYAYAEDVDFSLRVGTRGEVWSISSARLTHYLTQTARIARGKFIEQSFVNAALLFSRHRYSRDLRRGAFVRRLAGRTLAYALLSLSTRSTDPIAGTVRGLRRVPRALRAAG